MIKHVMIMTKVKNKFYNHPSGEHKLLTMSKLKTKLHK